VTGPVSSPPRARVGPNPRLVVSWIPHHGRSDAIARALAAEAWWAPWAASGASRGRTLRGWVRSSVGTVARVARVPRGGLVVVMVPPVFALAAVQVLARRRDLRVVADLHSAALDGRLWQWAQPWQRRLLRRCDAVLVTNTQLLDVRPVVQRALAGVEVIVLHDPPAPRSASEEPGAVPAAVLAAGRPWVLFPASGADDEPLAVVAQAAARLADRVQFVVTGRRTGLEPGPGLVLPGFLPDADYRAVLEGSAAVLALTTRPNTMQRAAYEALEAGRPLVCSRSRVLEEFFGSGAEYCENSVESLVAAVERALAGAADLVAGQETVRTRRQTQFLGAVERLLTLAPP
jgi:glycosyltransferase involved in cell wall biosynthesis